MVSMRTPIRFESMAVAVAILVPMQIVTMPSARAATSSLFTGFELSNQDSRRIDAGLSTITASDTSFDLFASRTDSSAEGLDFTSTSALARVEHDFGRFGLGVGGRYTRDENLTRTLGWIASGFIDAASARVSASVESRETDFADSPFSATGAELGLLTLASFTGTASCDVKSLGYHLGLRWDKATHSLYASGTKFDYSSYHCGIGNVLASSGILAPGADATTRPALVARFASAVTDRLSGYSASLAPRESVLLDSTVMVGASFWRGSKLFGIELYRDGEKFADIDSSTLLGFVSVPLAGSTSLELAVGATDTSLLDTSAFAGLRLSVFLQ